MNAPYVVETSSLTKRFGERVAVDNVHRRVPRGCAFRLRAERRRQDDRDLDAARPARRHSRLYVDRAGRVVGQEIHPCPIDAHMGYSGIWVATMRPRLAARGWRTPCDVARPGSHPGVRPDRCVSASAPGGGLASKPDLPADSRGRPTGPSTRDHPAQVQAFTEHRLAPRPAPAADGAALHMPVTLQGQRPGPPPGPAPWGSDDVRDRRAKDHRHHG